MTAIFHFPQFGAWTLSLNYIGEAEIRVKCLWILNWRIIDMMEDNYSKKLDHIIVIVVLSLKRPVKRLSPVVSSMYHTSSFPKTQMDLLVISDSSLFKPLLSSFRVYCSKFFLCSQIFPVQDYWQWESSLYLMNAVSSIHTEMSLRERASRITEKTTHTCCIILTRWEGSRCKTKAEFLMSHHRSLGVLACSHEREKWHTHKIVFYLNATSLRNQKSLKILRVVVYSRCFQYIEK